MARMAKARYCLLCFAPLPEGSAGPCDDDKACAERALGNLTESEDRRYPWMRKLLERKVKA